MDSVRTWLSVASSSDGIHLVAGTDNQLLTSSDAGATWVTRKSGYWPAVCSSADGSHLLAAGYGDKLYTSTDFGVSWSPTASPHGWLSVASSIDGTRLIASDYAGYIYISVDSGATWSTAETPRRWSAVASSGDGSILAATVDDGQVFLSKNAGVTWEPQAPNNYWTAIAISSDGLQFVAAADSAPLYTLLPSQYFYRPMDANQDNSISLSELLRGIQFFNSGGIHCAQPPNSTEDGYEPGPGSDQTCASYINDYNPQDWEISLSELLRVIQFYNAGGYTYCPKSNTEDGYCPGF